MKESALDRRTFVRGSFLALLGGATVTIVGCGDSPMAPSLPTAAVPPPAADVAGSVASNHGHSAVITAAQFSAAGELQLSIRGTASHDHMIELSAAEISAVRRGVYLEKMSSGTGHKHLVTFNVESAGA
jgi:hypothetical protein